MSQIKWMPLRLNNLVLHHRQTYQLLEKFIKIRGQILQGDILGLSTIMTIQSSVSQRIEQMDAFYQSRLLDPRAKHIFSIRTILRQIQQGCQQFRKSYQKYGNEDNQSQIKSENHSRHQLSSQIYSRQKLVPQDSSSYQQHPLQFNQFKHPQDQSRLSPINKANSHIPINKINSYTPINQVSQSNKYQKPYFPQKKPQEVRLSDLKKNNKEKQKITLQQQSMKKHQKNNKQAMMKEESKKGSSKKVEGSAVKKGEEISQTMKYYQKQRRQVANKLEQDKQIKQSFKDLSELVFTIKMTKQEYHQFMRLKRKNNHA